MTESTMSELETNQKIADRICRDLEYDKQQFATGDCVALLDGEIVAVTKSLDEALTRLRTIDPDPDRGMLLEIEPTVVDIVRY